MFLSNLNATRRPWPSKRPSSPTRSPLLVLTIIVSLLLFVSYHYLAPTSLISSSASSTKTLNPVPLRCSIASPEKFLFFAPHSGFSNQLSEFKNAVLIAGILNRTVVVPPVLDHHAVALGSCPKFRVSSPGELRVAVWDHAVELIRSGRYVSIADIVDISSLVSSSLVRAIDFRVFASQLCNFSLDSLCDNDSSSLDKLKRCGSMLSKVDRNVGNCLHTVNEDCRTTIWTYRNSHEDGELDSFQPDEQLKRKKNISFVRVRRDVYKSLGPSSEADSATVLAFGSLFSSPYKNSESYIDIHESPRDQRIQNLIEKSKFLPFAPEIISAGKRFARETIQAPFLCAQLRLLDGQFKNHWKSTFLGLKQKVESLEQNSRPVHIFVMTDLPEANWTGSYLGNLAKDMHRFKLFSLKENDDLVVNTARRLVENGNIKQCGSSVLLDALLYIEETICSCGSLGFVGTSGSTIAESIELMRKFRVCSS